MDKLSQNEKDQIADDVRKQTLAELEARNVNTKRIAQLLDEELQAFETKFFSYEGEIFDQRDVIAHGPRLKAAEIAIALLDIKPAEKQEHSGSVNLRTEFTEADRQILTTLGDKLVDAILREHRARISGDPAGS